MPPAATRGRYLVLSKALVANNAQMPKALSMPTSKIVPISAASINRMTLSRSTISSRTLQDVNRRSQFHINLHRFVNNDSEFLSGTISSRTLQDVNRRSHFHINLSRFVSSDGENIER